MSVRLVISVDVLIVFDEEKDLNNKVTILKRMLRLRVRRRIY
jgi:hypothetical protein